MFLTIFAVCVVVGIVGQAYVMSKLTPEQKARALARQKKIHTLENTVLYVAGKGLSKLTKNTTPKRYRTWH